MFMLGKVALSSRPDLVAGSRLTLWRRITFGDYRSFNPDIAPRQDFYSRPSGKLLISSVAEDYKAKVVRPGKHGDQVSLSPYDFFIILHILRRLSCILS